jgi:hypothetical protein
LIIRKLTVFISYAGPDFSTTKSRVSIQKHGLIVQSKYRTIPASGVKRLLWLSLKRALQLRDSMGLRDKEAPKGKALKYSKEEMDKWQLDDIYQKI